MGHFKFNLSYLLLAFCLSYSINTTAQCVVINEIMVDPTSCDCGCSTGNGEWVELYNTCSTPVNIGCFVLTDGDFAVTIPSNTILAPYDYYVIGSPASGGTIDLNLLTCNCTDNTAPDPIGCYTNSNEQVVLVNASGALQDAIYWGNGQFPLSISSTSHSPCSGQSILFPSASTAFELIPKTNQGGCSIARNCDGVTGNWVQRCGAAISMNSSNGPTLKPSFTATDTTICPGSCIDFVNTSVGSATSWLWTFTGALPPNPSSLASPTNICFPGSGNFSVTLQGTNSCGNFTLTKTNYIVSTPTVQPTITPATSPALCSGDSILLQASPSSNYQWRFNNNIISGATLPDYVVKIPGSYSVETGIGNCISTSIPVSINFISQPNANLISNGPTTICGGGSSQLDAGNGFSSYTWLKNGIILVGQNGPSLTVTAGGNYAVIVSNSSGCKDTSNTITIQASLGFSVKILANDTTLCAGETALLSLNDSYPSVQWSTGSTANSISVKQTGTFKVQASNSAGCSGNDSIKITVYPLPDVNAGNDTVADCGQEVVLNGKSLGSTFLWSPSEGLSDATSLNPIAKPTKSTMYTLLVSNAYCFSQDEVFISVDCGSMYLPNSFTPNGDGINDVFRASSNGISQFEMRIFNRWGELIFESNNPEVGWDGKYQNLPAPSGVYVREIIANNELGISVISDNQRYGTIVLYR